eukprot:scaffold66031_cov63-Attheya_sp.AAC.3
MEHHHPLTKMILLGIPQMTDVVPTINYTFAICPPGASIARSITILRPATIRGSKQHQTSIIRKLFTLQLTMGRKTEFFSIVRMGSKILPGKD